MKCDMRSSSRSEANWGVAAGILRPMVSEARLTNDDGSMLGDERNSDEPTQRNESEWMSLT